MLIGYLINDIKEKICDVIGFEDGQIILKWRGEINSLVVHKSVEDFTKLHIKDKRSLVWEEDEGRYCRCIFDMPCVQCDKEDLRDKEKREEVKEELEKIMKSFK